MYFCTSFENVKKCVLGGCTITSKAKINIFWKIFRIERPRRDQRSEETISKNIDFSSLWGNRATTQNTFFDIFKSAKTQYGEKSETKIMKITHSELLIWNTYGWLEALLVVVEGNIHSLAASDLLDIEVWHHSLQLVVLHRFQWAKDI